MARQNLQNSFFSSRTIIITTSLFFASMNVAMADACSQKQLDRGCETKTSSTGYKWCDCSNASSGIKSGRMDNGGIIGKGGIGTGSKIPQPKKVAPVK